MQGRWSPSPGAGMKTAGQSPPCRLSPRKMSRLSMPRTITCCSKSGMSSRRVLGIAMSISYLLWIDQIGYVPVGVPRPRRCPRVHAKVGDSPFYCFLVDLNKQIVYNCSMIVSFASKETEKLFATGKSKKFPPEIIARSVMRLTQLDSARDVSDLLMPPSNRLEALSGNRTG